MVHEGAGELLARAQGPDWRRWQLLQQLPFRSIPVSPASRVDRVLQAGRGILGGWEFREQAGAALTWQIFDGADATGRLVVEATQAASVQGQLILIPGVRLEQGAFLHFATGTGTILGAFYLASMEDLGGYERD